MLGIIGFSIAYVVIGILLIDILEKITGESVVDRGYKNNPKLAPFELFVIILAWPLILTLVSISVVIAVIYVYIIRGGMR